MEPATSIIKSLGGPEQAARDIGVHRTRVFSWMRPRENGGTDGAIPQRHFATILRLAREKGVQITPEDLIGSPHSGVGAA